VHSAFGYLAKIFSKSLFKAPLMVGNDGPLLTVLGLIVFFILVEWFGREEQFALEIVSKSPSPFVRKMAYMLIALGIIIFGNVNANKFIYFQF